MSWVFPIKDAVLGHLGTWGSLRSEFDCLLGVLMHARIDALMHPHFWSLLPSSVFDWVVIAVSIRDATMPLNTPRHPVSITLITLCSLHRTVLLSVGAHEHCSRHRRSTSSEEYCCQGDTSSLPHGTHHNFWCPWVGPN